MDMRATIRERALKIGFDLVGFAPATPGHDLDFAREWQGRGYGGEMHYLANAKRFNPHAVLPALKSVICVGLIYNTPLPYSSEVHPGGVRSQESEARGRRTGSGRHPTVVSGPMSVEGRNGHRTMSEGQPPVLDFDFRISKCEFPATDGTPHAWISRYAWGRDYHEIMREKLEQLRAAIEDLSPGAETRVYVDTGPVIERAFARFSGVGWMGKNTCIINEEEGSWFFLGVILTSLALEPDFPAPDRCGSCRACLDACPTGALVEPYVMDASRCISYLTIELKGSIPAKLRRGVGANVLGCDICQDVCPWNGRDRSQKSGARSQEKDFQPLSLSHQPPMNDEVQRTKDGIRQSAVSSRKSSNFRSSIFNLRSSPPGTSSLFNPPLEELASMTEADFRRTFARSPIKRVKHRGWLRNLCVAMGNSGDARLVPKLQELSQHPDPIVREHAAWALRRLAEN